MSVLLIRPPDPLQEVSLLSHTRPLNLAYLAAWLRRAGVPVALLDYELEVYDRDALLERLRRQRSAVVGFSATTPTVRGAAQLAALIKAAAPGVVTVVGGPHANGLPEATLHEFPAFDALVYGEGEETLHALWQTVTKGGSLAAIAGLVWRDGARVVRNGPRPLLAELDDLPLPARDLFVPARQAGHASRGFSNRVAAAELFTARGCPVACSFCAIQSAFGRRVRFHSLGRVAAEVSALVRQGVRHLVVADDTFSLNLDRARDLCSLFAHGGVSSWNCDTRVNSVTPELLRAMARNGCRKVAFGVESGSQAVLDRVGKGIQVEQVAAAVSWAREAGIPHIEGNFILGVDPDENEADLAATRRMILSLPWTFVSVAIIVPYPGTPVYRAMRERGLIAADAVWDDYVMFGRPPKWHTEHFSAERLLQLQRELTRAFYLRPGYVAARLAALRSWEETRYWFGAGAAYLRWYLRGRI